MNPFTRSLIGCVKDQALIDFVQHWDELEALVVRIYRAGSALPEDEAAHAELRRWLLEVWPRFEPRLRAYWPRTRVGREPAREDPLARLLTIERAADLVGNWAAMQTLPAARETLNLLLADWSDSTRTERQ